GSSRSAKTTKSLQSRSSAAPSGAANVNLSTNSDNDNETDNDGNHKQNKDEDDEDRAKGRLSKGLMAEANRIRERYDSDIRDLARKAKKSEAAIRSAMGVTVKDPRSLNAWNVFQHYQRAEDGENYQREPGQSEAEYRGEIQRRYQELLALSEEEKDRTIAELIEWYNSKLDAYTAVERVQGVGKNRLRKLAKPFMDRARMVYETQELCVFGWAVDPLTSTTIQWGADPLFEAMRNQNVSNMTLQATDYGALIHVQHMRRKQESVLAPEKQSIIDRYSDNKTVVRSLISNLFVVLFNEASPDANITHMSWGDEFAKLCLDHKVCLHGWPDVKHVPGVPGENGLKEASALPVPSGRKILKARIRFWQSLSAEDAVDEEEPLLEDDLVRFVPWDDEIRSYALQDLADIPIQSKLYRLRVQARGMDLNNTDSEDNDNDDENQHEEGDEGVPASKSGKAHQKRDLGKGVFVSRVRKTASWRATEEGSSDSKDSDTNDENQHSGEEDEGVRTSKSGKPWPKQDHRKGGSGSHVRQTAPLRTTKALDARIHASETRGGEGRASGLSAEEERVLRIALTKLNQSAEGEEGEGEQRVGRNQSRKRRHSSDSEVDSGFDDAHRRRALDRLDRLSNGGGTGGGEMGKAEQRKGKRSGAGATEVPRKKTKLGDRAEKLTNIRPVKWRRRGEGRQERQN
ncbi:hypothetical protein F5890DRAFT_1559890, partial [Lentinula detonsa]